MPQPPPPPARLARLDLCLAALLALAAGAFYATLHQRQLWGDGYRLFDMAVGDGWRWWDTWNHIAYTPVAAFFVALGAGRLPFDDVSLASSVPAALAVGASALLARLAGCGRAASLLAAALVGLAPAVAFFATVIEVHALHAAGVALALLASALLAPRLGPRGFQVAHAALFALVSTTHLSAPTLGPGWLIAGALLAHRHHPELVAGARRWRFLVTQTFGLAAAYATVVAIADITAYRRHDRGAAEGIVELLHIHAERRGLAFVHAEWWEPLGVASWPLLAAVVLAALGTLAPRARALLEREPRVLVLLGVAWLALPFGFFVAWGVANEGGYLLGSFPVLVVMLACLPRLMSGARGRAAALVVLAATVPVQVWIAHRTINAYRAQHEVAGRPARLAAVADALPTGGALVGFDPLQQPAWIELADVRDIDLYLDVWGAYQDASAADELRALAERLVIERVAPLDGPVVVDRAYRTLAEASGDPRLLAVAEGFESALARLGTLRPIDDPRWPLARLVRSDAGD